MDTLVGQNISSILQLRKLIVIVTLICIFICIYVLLLTIVSNVINVNVIFIFKSNGNCIFYYTLTDFITSTTGMI